MIVLIVDDDEGVLRVFSRLLIEQGISCKEEVRTAKSIQAAFALMREIPLPDLVFLDLILESGQDPKETLKSIKEFRRINPEAVIIVVTGAIEDRLPALAMEMGADGFGEKRSIAGQNALLEMVKSGIHTNSERAKKTGVHPLESNLALLEKFSGKIL